MIATTLTSAATSPHPSLSEKVLEKAEGKAPKKLADLKKIIRKLKGRKLLASAK